MQTEDGTSTFDRTTVFGVKQIMDALNIPGGIYTDIVIHFRTNEYPKVYFSRGIPDSRGKAVLDLIRQIAVGDLEEIETGDLVTSEAPA